VHDTLALLAELYAARLPRDLLSGTMHPERVEAQWQHASAREKKRSHRASCRCWARRTASIKESNKRDRSPGASVSPGQEREGEFSFALNLDGSRSRRPTTCRAHGFDHPGSRQIPMTI